MPHHSYFVLAAFSILGMVLIVQVAGLRNNGVELLGKPTIDKYYFYTGKVTMAISWGLFLVKALLPKLGYIPVPPILCWIATGLLWVGAFMTALAIIGLGKSLKVGLPDTATTLKTRGIYSFSRNPLYTGVYLITIGSVLYFPDLINFSFTIFSIYIHHQIIKSEENFLKERFGAQWEDYRLRVRRYL